ncbi:MAG: PAAR-like domain-containing protein [Polyangiaceae bacterium]
MFASTQMMGMNLAFPDVCLTPAPPAPAPVPLPYPNTSMGPTTAPFCPNILFVAAPAHNLTHPVVVSLGDTTGAIGGVASGTCMNNTRPMTGAFTVLLSGAPATRMTTINIQNSTNAPGMRIVPSQPKILILAP